MSSSAKRPKSGKKDATKSTANKTTKSKKKEQNEDDAAETQRTTIDCSDAQCSWDPCNVTADRIDWPEWAVQNTVKLLDEDNTIPFIARYRREQTNNMEADKLRELKTVLDDLRFAFSK